MRLPVIPVNDESVLLAAVAKGNEIAFRQLFDNYWPAVYRTSWAFTKSSVLAEEMTQDILLKIWLQHEKLASVENFRDYLFIVARNHILNALRKKLKEQNFLKHLSGYFILPAHTPEQQYLLKETEELVQQAIEQLPAQQQTVYCLSRQQGLSHHEIAGRLHLSTHTIKSHMNKALHFIRNFLHAHSEIVILLMVLLCQQ